MTWSVYASKPPDRTRHVLPDGDVVQHDRTANCTCGPRIEGVWCPDGMAAQVVLHHALDGRTGYLEEVAGE